MRSEIEKLIRGLRNDAERIAADHTRTSRCHHLTEPICHWCATKRLLIDTEARLRRILDADPVARLEAMGFIVRVGRDSFGSCLLANPKQAQSELQFMGSVISGDKTPSAAITDAATRLLARIEGREG